MNYFDELTKAMTMLAAHPKILFVGQAVKYDGQRAHATFKGVPEDRKIEMPVAEDFQMGFCTGLALEGYLPISFYPRFDFLILAANQLVNHLDKIPVMSAFRPKVIIRTIVGATTPLNPGPQHTQDHSKAFRMMLKTIEVVELTHAGQILPAYEGARASQCSTILVEHMRLY